MLEQIAQVMNPLPPVRTRKKAWLAFVLGFLFSGIALGIFFRNWVDLVVPTVIWLVLTATPGDAGFWAGAVIGGLWGVLLGAIVVLLLGSVVGGGGMMGGLGQMMGGAIMGGGLFGMLFALLFWVLIIALIVALVVWIFNQTQRR